MEVIYNLTDENEAVEDIALLAEGFKLLQFDYLGGHGSRGYGKVKFNNLSAEAVVGEPSDEIMNKINKLLGEVK